MASRNTKTPESAIEEGRQHYAAKRFKLALEQFTRAMKLCPCARGMKRERCSCKNYEKVALEAGSIFNEAMYNCSCSVGKTFNKCDKASHIQALDYRAATFEAIQELERARRDAEWILELAPRLPDGYLRLGKIARLQKKYELAWTIYNAGIEVGNNNRLAGPKLQVSDNGAVRKHLLTVCKKLYAARQPLQLRFCRRDPLRNPQEIVHRIFSNVDFASLVRCLRVSKAWRQYLSSRGNECLWRDLQFTRIFPHGSAPSLNAVKSLVSYSGKDIRKLVINNVARFRLNQAKLNAMMQGSKNLDFLSLQGHTHEELHFPEKQGFLNKLTHIILDEFAIAKAHLLQPLLRNSAESLRHLHVAGMPLPESIGDLGFPDMPNLKCLRLEERHNSYPVRLSIFLVAEKTPNLEQLWLTDLHLRSNGLVPEKFDEYWKNLKVIIVNGSKDLDDKSAETIRRMTSIRRGRDLEYVDFDCRWRYDQAGPLDPRRPSNMLHHVPVAVPGDEDFDLNNYTNLRSLRLRRALSWPSQLEQVLVDSITGRNLHTLDLVFPLEPGNSPMGQWSSQHLEGHSWLKGAPSIRCLGVSDFRFRKFPKNDVDLPLPSFLASFPNLETLEINSAHYDQVEFCTVIDAILKVTKLKRIYQTTVQGVMMDELKVRAEMRGVELIWCNRPREWPVRIEE
ncbi:Fc.00g101120.m01.CDS01 [Cosmosporella sp. VM-42]